MLETNVRSIFSVLKENYLNRLSEEYPVPHSSMLKRTPKAFAFCSTPSGFPLSPIAIVSTISKCKVDGSRLVSSRAELMSDIKPGYSNSRAVTLRLNVSGGSEGNSACHDRIFLHASSRSQRFIGRIRPLSSATEINSAGGTKPTSGFCQRTNASKPAILLSERRTTG